MAAGVFALSSGARISEDVRVGQAALLELDDVHVGLHAAQHTLLDQQFLQGLKSFKLKTRAVMSGRSLGAWPGSSASFTCWASKADAAFQH